VKKIGKKIGVQNIPSYENQSKTDFFCVETHFFLGGRHCAAVLQTQVPKLCTDLDLRLLYILILGTYSKFARKNNFLACSARRLLFAALLQRWPQVCRVKITFRVLLTIRFVSITKISMKCVVNWIPLRIRVRSRNTKPHPKPKSASSILQALSCRFFGCNLLVLVFPASKFHGFLFSFSSKSPPGIFSNRVGRVFGSAKRADF